MDGDVEKERTFILEGLTSKTYSIMADSHGVLNLKIWRLVAHMHEQFVHIQTIFVRRSNLIIYLPICHLSSITENFYHYNKGN